MLLLEFRPISRQNPEVDESLFPDSYLNAPEIIGALANDADTGIVVDRNFRIVERAQV